MALEPPTTLPRGNAMRRSLSPLRARSRIPSRTASRSGDTQRPGVGDAAVGARRRPGLEHAARGRSASSAQTRCDDASRDPAPMTMKSNSASDCARSAVRDTADSAPTAVPSVFMKCGVASSANVVRRAPFDACKRASTRSRPSSDEHLEKPGTDHASGHRDARCMNQRACLDAALFRELAQRRLERRCVERRRLIRTPQGAQMICEPRR